MMRVIAEYATELQQGSLITVDEHRAHVRILPLVKQH